METEKGKFKMNENEIFKKYQLEMNERIGFIERELENYPEHKTDIEDLRTDVPYISQRLDNIESHLNKKCDDLEELIYEIKEKIRDCNRKPYKCPVCNGNGNVLSEGAKLAFNQYMTTGLDLSHKCLSCDGKGIVWG